MAPKTAHSVIIHLCGLPGSGKTTFCRWLEAEKGFKNLEFDKIRRGIGSKEDVALLRGKTPKEFVQEIRGLRQPTVLDWAFHPYEDLDLVKETLEEGVTLWWFDADHRAARESMSRRANAPMEAFRVQMTNIDSQWPKIKEMVGKNIIQSLRADGSFLPPAEIYARMFGD